jgi:hypothetical protein
MLRVRPYLCLPAPPRSAHEYDAQGWSAIRVRNTLACYRGVFTVYRYEAPSADEHISPPGSSQTDEGLLAQAQDSRTTQAECPGEKTRPQGSARCSPESFASTSQASRPTRVIILSGDDGSGSEGGVGLDPASGLVAGRRARIANDPVVVLMVLDHQHAPAHGASAMCSTRTGNMKEKVEPFPARSPPWTPMFGGRRGVVRPFARAPLGSSHGTMANARTGLPSMPSSLRGAAKN